VRPFDLQGESQGSSFLRVVTRWGYGTHVWTISPGDFVTQAKVSPFDTTTSDVMGDNADQSIPSIGGLCIAGVLYTQPYIYQDINPGPLPAHLDLPSCPLDHTSHIGHRYPLQPRRFHRADDHLYPTTKAMGQHGVRHLPQSVLGVVSRCLHHWD
jgi:hypothetical protein